MKYDVCETATFEKLNHDVCLSLLKLHWTNHKLKDKQAQLGEFSAAFPARRTYCRVTWLTRRTRAPVGLGVTMKYGLFVVLQ